MEQDIAHIVNTFTSLGDMSSLTNLDELINLEIKNMLDMVKE